MTNPHEHKSCEKREEDSATPEKYPCIDCCLCHPHEGCELKPMQIKSKAMQPRVLKVELGISDCKLIANALKYYREENGADCRELEDYVLDTWRRAVDKELTSKK